MPAVGGEGGHNASMTDVILDKKKVLLAHYVSQVQQIQSSPNTTKVEMHLSRILMFAKADVSSRHFTGFILHPHTHPSFLVPLTYELEQYFPFERYPSGIPH